MPTILPYLSGGKNWEHVWSPEFRAKDSLKDWNLITGLENTSPFPTLDYITKSLFIVVPFIQHIMCGYQEKNIRHTKRQKKSESISGMAEMLEWWDLEFKTTMINRLRVPMNKTDSLQEQMGNTGKEVEILWKNQKEMLRIKNTVKQKLRMFLMNLVDWTQLKKEILGLRIPQ